MSMILLTHTFATLFMTGLIWFVQIVHYPLFDQVGADQFETYERRHQRLTTFVVGPVMLMEAGSAVMLVRVVPENWTNAAWIGLILLGVIWLTTSCLSIPAHRSLQESFTDSAHRKLVRTNWIRTIAWTIRGIIALTIPGSSVASAIT